MKNVGYSIRHRPNFCNSNMEKKAREWKRQLYIFFKNVKTKHDVSTCLNPDFNKPTIKKSYLDNWKI